jgi:hypothetical protein
MCNRIGPRIYIVGNNQFEEIWEYSRTVLDLQATKSFWKNRIELRFNIKDLLAKGQPNMFLQNYASGPLKYKDNNYTKLWYTQLGTTYSGQLIFKF